MASIRRREYQVVLLNGLCTHFSLCSQNEVGSEMILSNAESYGQYFAQALMNRNVNITDSTIAETMAVTRDNIGTDHEESKINVIPPSLQLYRLNLSTVLTWTQFSSQKA